MAICTKYNNRQHLCPSQRSQSKLFKEEVRSVCKQNISFSKQQLEKTPGDLRTYHYIYFRQLKLHDIIVVALFLHVISKIVA